MKYLPLLLAAGLVSLSPAFAQDSTRSIQRETITFDLPDADSSGLDDGSVIGRRVENVDIDIDGTAIRLGDGSETVDIDTTMGHRRIRVHVAPMAMSAQQGVELARARELEARTRVMRGQLRAMKSELDRMRSSGANPSELNALRGRIAAADSSLDQASSALNEYRSRIDDNPMAFGFGNGGGAIAFGDSVFTVDVPEIDTAAWHRWSQQLNQQWDRNGKQWEEYGEKWQEYGRQWEEWARKMEEMAPQLDSMSTAALGSDGNVFMSDSALSSDGNRRTEVRVFRNGTAPAMAPTLPPPPTPPVPPTVDEPRVRE